MNSINPLDLTEGFYLRSINTLNRGGVIQCRPGYRWVTTLPDGNVQGFTMFTPRGSTPQLIAVVAGRVYRSLLPYSEFEEIEGIELAEFADKVYFAHATKSTQRNEDDSVSLIVPVNTLIIQDNQSAPAFYDGSASGHITGDRTTPVGGPMKWTGDRLWVSEGNRIYVSDIADPYSFVEDTYNTLGGRESFLVDGEVVGMAETPGLASPQLLVFTDSQTVAFQSNVRERSAWATLPDFQKTIFNVGCVSHRSIIAQHGLLWWFSPFGLLSFDGAVLAEHSSELEFQDNEMASSKARLHSDLSGVAGASFENYLLLSTPHSDIFNPHTWVLDFTVRNLLNEKQPRAWASVWTGTRPVEWASGSVQGVPRIFYISRDHDDKTRVWEAFSEARRDEFSDIDWSIETRAYTAKTIAQKEFRYAEMQLSDLQGAVDLKVSWAGAIKGRWRSIANSRVWSNEGNISTEEDLPAKMFGLKKQTRLYRTQDVRDMTATELAACGIESSTNDVRDVGFQLCIQGSGPCAIQNIRVFLDTVNEDNDGACTPSEDEGRYVRMDGAASNDLDELQSGFETEYTATASFEASYGDVTVVGVGEAISTLSQAAADKLALQRAKAKANVLLLAQAEPFIGGGVEEEEFTGSLDFSIASNSQYISLL